MSANPAASADTASGPALVAETAYPESVSDDIECERPLDGVKYPPCGSGACPFKAVGESIMDEGPLNVLSVGYTQRKGELASGGVDGPSLVVELNDDEGVSGGVSRTAGRHGEPEVLLLLWVYFDFDGDVSGVAARSRGRR